LLLIEKAKGSRSKGERQKGERQKGERSKVKGKRLWDWGMEGKE
jgi:hypothetical protein